MISIYILILFFDSCLFFNPNDHNLLLMKSAYTQFLIWIFIPLSNFSITDEEKFNVNIASQPQNGYIVKRRQ